MKVTKKEIAECKGRIDSLGSMIVDLKGEIWDEMYSLVKKHVGRRTIVVGEFPDQREIRCNPELETRTKKSWDEVWTPFEDFDDEFMYKVFEELFGPVEDQR